MDLFTFSGAKGVNTTVEAPDEATARNKAMTERWGPETGIYVPYYNGVGLVLLSRRPKS
jgi:hypothetical protein